MATTFKPPQIDEVSALNQEIRKLSDEIDERVNQEISKTPWGEKMDLQAIREEFAGRIDALYERINTALAANPNLRYNANGYIDERG